MPQVRPLTKENFCEQMLRYGFFYEQIPQCFTSSSFADHAHELLKPLQSNRSSSTAPFSMPIHKSTLARRTVSIPNPKAFATTVKYLGSKWRLVEQLAESENSHSPITCMISYDECDSEYINCENLREVHHVRSDFIANVIERNILSQGHTIKLSIDLHAFYDSIYTHSLSWAICGKTEAKRYYENKKLPKPLNYDFADSLDKLTRNMKGQETNGILTGPYTSRIFSELLLAGVDRTLRSRHYVFRRYVDDYSFYFETEAQAQLAASDIEDVMRSFGLKINHEKTKLEGFPFDTASDMRYRLRQAADSSGAYGLLNEASRLHLEGEKGAYKYALKMLQGMELSGNHEAVIAILFNIGLSNPRQCRLITAYLKQNADLLDCHRLSHELNSSLERALDANREQEYVNLLAIGQELGLPIAGPSIARAIESDNDLTRIIALSYWVHANTLVTRTQSEAKRINEAKNTLTNMLQGSTYDGEHWLLLYEAEQKSLLDISRTSGKTDDFFDSMSSCGVSFYSGIGKSAKASVSPTIDDYYRSH